MIKSNLFTLSKIIVSFLAHFGWLMTSCICLLLGYMLVWHRGLYMDDYSHVNIAINPVTGAWIPIWQRVIPTFPVRILGWAIDTELVALSTQNEFITRFIMMLGVGANGLLLGWLIYRVMRSRLAAVIGGWLFLMPIFASDAVLWSGAYAYPLGTTVMLLFLHMSWSMLISEHHWISWAIISVAVFAALLLIAETFASILAILPILSISIIIQRQRKFSLLINRIFISLVLPIIVMTVFYIFIYRNSPLVEERGGFESTVSGILNHALGFFQGIEWWVFSPDWGIYLLKQSFFVGKNAILETWEGIIIFTIAIILIVFTAVTWHKDSNQDKQNNSLGLIILFAGISWFFLLLLLPGVLVKGQLLESRMLYIPGAGFGMVIGIFVWAICKQLRHIFWERLIIGIMGILLLGSTISMLGYTKAAAERYKLDQKQVNALVYVLPSKLLPKESYIIPFNTEETILGQDDGLARIKTGVFETPWSTIGALNTAYHRDDLTALTANRWVAMKFTYNSQVSSSNQLIVQGISVPIERTVIFTYKSGRAIIIKDLVISDDDGSQHTIHFPIAEEIYKRGVETMDITVKP